MIKIAAAERLEERLLLTAEIVNVAGTAGADHFLLQMNQDGVTLELLNGEAIVQSVLLSDVGEINIYGGAGYDTLEVNLESGLPFPLEGIHFDGEADGGALLLTQGSSSEVFSTITHTLTDHQAGSISIDSQTVSFSNAEKVTDHLIANSRQFIYLGGSEFITLSDAGTPDDGDSRIDSTSGPEVFFNSTVQEISVSTGTGADEIHVQRLDQLFSSHLNILGDESDQVKLEGPELHMGDHRLQITGQTITVASHLSSDSGEIVLDAARNIVLQNGSTLETVDGDLTLLANSDASAVGDFSGITAYNTAIVTTGTGGISLTGTGANDVTSPGFLSNGHNGIMLYAGTSIRSTSAEADAGQIYLTGTGGVGIDSNKGIAASKANISSVAGDIDLTGRGGSNAAGGFNDGILLSDTTISSEGIGSVAAAISLTGVGGSGVMGNSGVSLTGTYDVTFAAGIQSINGDIAISGTGGGGDHSLNNVGILLKNFNISSTGTGPDAATITLIGMGGEGTSYNYGVSLYPSIGTTKVTSINSIDGDIYISGQGGGFTNLGVNMTQSLVSSSGTGADAAEITIISGGTYLFRNAARMESAAGNINISVNQDEENQSSSFVMTDSSLINSGQGNLHLDADEDIYLTRLISQQMVQVDASQGSIFDNDDENPEVYANTVSLNAMHSVGTAENPLEVSAQHQTASGTVHVTNSFFKKLIGVDDADFSTSGTWTASNQTPTSQSQLIASGTDIDTATWIFSNLIPGIYRLSGFWMTDENNTANAELSVSGIAGGEVKQYIDQRRLSADLTDGNVSWQDLGFFVVDADGTIAVSLSDNQANGNVVAGAMRIEKMDSLVSITGVEVYEDSGTAELTVTSSQAVGSSFSLSYVTIDRTATAGADYTETSGTLDFMGTTDGESHTIIVPLIDDSNLELTKMFQVALSDISAEANLALVHDLATVVIRNDDGVVIAEDAGEQIIQLDDISALDSNSQVIAVSAVSGDSSLILQPIVEFTPGSSSATLKFRPEQDAHGSTQLMVITTDDHGNQVTSTIPVLVQSVNDPPVAIDDTFYINENSDLAAVNVFAANSSSADHDPDGQPFVVSAVQGGRVGTQFLLNSGALLTIDSKGDLNYDPHQQFESLAENESATDSFTYTISDTDGATSVATVTVVITGENDAPVVSNSIVMTYSEDDAVDSLNLLSDASDPDVSDSLGISNLVWSGDAGGVSVNGMTLTVDPGYFNDLAVGETAVLSGTYEVVDSQGAAVAQSVTLTFEGQNDAPVVSDAIAVTYSEDDAVDTLDLLEQASDPDRGDSLGIRNLVWTGDAGGVSVNGTMLTVTPGYFNSLAAGASAELTGTYEVVDAHGAVVAQSVTLTYEGQNDAPVVSDAIAVTYSEDDAVDTLDLLEQASDPDRGDSLEISNQVWSGDAGGVSVNGTTLTVDPGYFNRLAVGETAVLSGTYDVVDSQGAAVSRNVTLTFTGANDAPDAEDDQISVAADTVETIDVLQNDSDPDLTDHLSILGFDAMSASGAAISIVDGKLHYDPVNSTAIQALSAGEILNDTFTYTITDSQGEKGTAVVTVQLTGVNDRPHLIPLSEPMLLNNSTPTQQINLNDIFDDVDDSSLVYQVVSYTSGLLDYELAGAQLTLTGLAGQSGNGTIVVEARDAGGLTVTSEIAVVVDVDPLEQIEKLQYALVSDQVMDFHGQNTFVLETNVMNASQVTVTSADSEVLSADDVTVESLGDGRLRVTVHHTSDEFGVTSLRFRISDQRIISDLNIIVVAPQEVSLSDIGPLTMQLQEGQIPGEGTVISKTINARLPSVLIREGIITAEEGLAMVRPVSPIVSAYSLITDGATYENTIERNDNMNQSNYRTTMSSATNGTKLWKTRFSLVHAYIIAYFKYSSPKEVISSVDLSGAKEDVIQEVKSDPFSVLAPIETVSHAIVNNADFTVTETGEPVTEEKRDELRAHTHTVINWISLANASSRVKKLPKDFKDLMEDLKKLPEREQVNKVMVFMGKTISNLKTLFEKGMEITQYYWGNNSDVDKQVYSRVIGKGLDFNSATFSSEEQLRATIMEDDDISNEVKEIALDFAETLRDTAEFHSYLLNELSIQKDTDPSNSSVIIDSSEQLHENPISSDMRESSGENGKDNTKAIQDGEIVREVYSAAQSVYSISQSIQGIVDNIGQIFSSSGGALGEYTDNDGHTYNIYDNQNRSGTDGRDIINTGEGNDRVFAFKGDDRVITSKGNDIIDAGNGRNYVFAAGGEDSITDGNGDSILSAGAGGDVIRPGGGNDLIEGGLGHDVIIYGDPNNSTRRTYDTRDIGNDILIDPTKSGEIHFRSHSFDEMTFRKDRYDLEIILPSDDGFHSNTLKFQSFFKLDAAGWEIIDALGNHYNLYDITGRITSYETLEMVFGQQTGNSTPAYPAGIDPLTTIQDSSTRFTMHVASDNRLAAERGLVLTLEGDNSIVDWISRNKMASLESANEMLADLKQQYQFSDYEHVTLVGVGEGGLIAQWIAAAASTSGVEFVNVQLVNAPDISGLISQVVREEYPEYTAGFPVESTYYLINPNDWVSRIGIWAGNDETYANWKAFSFDYDAQEELPILLDLSEIQAAHAPAVSAGDFDELTMHDMDLSLIRGHMSLMQSDNFSVLYANDETTLDNQLFDSTTNAREVFFDTLADESEEDPIEASAPARNQFNTFLTHDPAAVDPDTAFSLKLDFQTAAQGSEHTAPDYHAVNETTLYTPEATALLTYGWSQITSGVKEGKDLGRATSLERDYVLVSENTFIIELPAPGTYNISITFGDRENIRESTQVFVNGYASDRVSTMPGDFLTRSYQVSTLDDELRLTFVDRGGQTDFSAINGVTVDQVNYRATLPINEQLDNDPSIVLMTGGYELPESNGFIDTLEDTLKAAAMAVATAVLPGIGAGLMSFSTFASSFSSAVIGTAANATVGSVIANSVGKAVVSSLVSSIPKHFISDPTARGILGGAISIYSGIDGVTSSTNPVTRLQKVSSTLKKLSGGLGAINGSLTATNAIVQAVSGNTDAPPADEWMYEAAASLAQMSQKYRLGRIDAGFTPVSLDEINNAIANGKTGEQLLKLWTGSRDFLVLDWVPDGLELTDVSTSEHKNLVNKSARALKKLIEAYVEKLREGDPESQVDLLLISQGAGYDVHRELVDRLNTSDIEEGLDYVKIVTLDPVSFDEYTGRWVHPELTSIVDRIDNFFQTEDTPDGDLYHVGRPLDYRIGGGSAGFYNRQARVFDLTTTEELLRFRHWDANEVSLSTAELTDIEFSADGSLVAVSGKDGMVTVRYVDDVPDPDSETGELLHAAGDVKFIVWGQESKVRSLAFIKMQVDGIWKDFLLTISAANNPDNSDIDKNKVLLTDVETGLPVWQGRDIKGTQVEASPSGNLIVSTDANGRAKIWKRVGDTLTFEKYGDLVDAHPADDGSYIADVYVINDRYFVTAGLDKRLKLFRITDDGAELVQTEKFDNEFQGKVRNLDYDPYNGILAVASGQELSLWKFDQTAGKLTPLGPEGQSVFQPFTRHDHTAAIQGVSFSKPSFLLDETGQYLGDRVLPGTEIELPRTADGDIDLEKLPEFLESHQLPDSYAGLKLLTGGEDKTLFLYSLDRLDIGDVREESVLSGAMLPIREVTLSPDGSRVAVVGQDNVEDDSGGPVKDIDVTDELDERLGWKFSEIFLQGRREHNAVPQQYIYDVIEEKGESYFWLRNSSNANRPGSIDKDRNLALPPNKRDNKPGVDVAPIELYIRPGQTIDVKALHYLLEVDREDYTLDQDSLPVGDVKDADGNVVGTLKQKMKNGNPLPNVLVFEAFDETQLDYSDPLRNEYTGVFTLTMIGPPDLEGNQVEKTAEVKIRIINHKPIAYADVVELHPNRSEIDYRPKANDYDFDNDDFTLYNFPTTKQVLTYQGVEVATVRKNSDSTNGIDIVVTVTEETLTTLLAQMQASIPDGEPVPDYLSIEFTYQVKEEKYGAISTGTVEVRLQLQAGPENVTFDELGADQVRIQWDPVSWSANKYIVERFDAVANQWVKHASNAEVYGNQSDSMVIKGLTANTDYWFRVVAINTNSGRRHASYPGDDKEGGLHLKTPGYVGPGSVTMEVRGAALMEVNWEKVYWDLNKYIIELRELIVDGNGQLEMDGDAYRYNSETVRTKEVSQGNGLSVLFKKLSPDTPYLAVVTAKRGDEAHSTVAEYPVSTLERDLPAGINLERIGPKKIRVSWATVSFAQKYRIVAIDPRQPFLEEGRISQVVDASGGNTNSGVLTGLEPETEYIVIVEAKDKNGNWVSVLSDEYRPIVIPNIPVADNESQIDVSYEGDSEYLLQTVFNNMIRLPSTEGLFVGTTFSIRNLSYHDVQLKSFAGESINLYGQLTDKLTLKPALGPNVDPEATGIVVYRFTFLGDSWRVETSDNTSEARTVITPPYLAAEPGSFKKDDAGSLPKRLKIVWESPFWNVEKHNIELYEVLLDSEGHPLYEADGVTYQRASSPAVAGKTKRLDETDDRYFSYTFTGLKTKTDYIAVLTTTGLDNQKRVVEEIHVRTEDQQSPTGVDSKDVTLSSFTATWTEVKWNVQQYRVSFAEVGANGEVDESTREYRFVNNDKSSKVIDGLKTGVTYRFTVEARTADPDAETEWIENTLENIKEVTILSAADLSITGLTLDAARIRQLDLKWDKLDFAAEELSIELLLKGETDWDQAAKVPVQTDKVAKTLDDLGLNTEYQIRLMAKVRTSEGSPEYVTSSIINGATFWGIEYLKTLSPSKVEVKYLRLAIATHYLINIYDASNGELFYSEDVDQKSNTTISRVISGMKPGTKYDFELIALDGTQQLTVSKQQAITMPAVNKPTGLVVTDKGAGKIKVEWDALTWSPDTQYVQVWDDQSGAWKNVSGSEVDNGNSTVLTGLNPGESYLIQLYSALNLADGTQFTIESDRIPSFTLKDYPAPVLGPDIVDAFQNVRQKKVDVHWSFDGDPDEIDSFQILRENGNLLGTLNPANFPGQTSFVKEIERTANSSYFVFVRANYKDGSTLTSETLQLPKIDYVPGFFVNHETEDSADANWKQYSNAGVTGYRITVYKSGADEVVRQRDVEKGTGPRSITMDGLEQKTTYEMTVEALVGSDIIAGSDRAEFITKYVPPVPNMFVDQVYPTSVQANWGQVTGFSVSDYRILIYYQGTTDLATSKTVGQGSGDRRSTVTGLLEETRYEMVIEALDGTKVLSSSQPVAFTTSKYVTPEFGTPVSDAFTDVRQKKVIVNWSFAGDLEDIATFQIVRENGDVLGTLNPDSFPNQSYFEKEIDRSANSSYFVFIRANYKDGTTLKSNSLQLPKIDTVPGFFVSNETESSAEANWEQVQNAGVTDYRIVVYVRGTETLVAEKVVSKGTGSRKSTIDGLAQGTDYDMVIEALKNSEVIASSDRFQFRTLTVPPVPNMFVDQVYPTSVQANWGQVTGFPVSNYRIQIYYKGTSNLAATKTVDRGSGDRRSTVDGLSQGSQFDMVIEALDGSRILSSSSRVSFTTSAYVQPDFGPTATEAFSDVRAKKVIVHWSFAGDMEDIDTFQIVRENGTVLGTLNPANFPNQSAFEKEIDRTSNSKYKLFIRARYKDGTVLTSITLQLPAS
ncbi:fibronectin type III domain-containing protein [Gimesia panareensis]|nr:fibronectin type III domain-containing protein [Gimesia panareensis]